MFVPKRTYFETSEHKKCEGKLCCAIRCKNKPAPKKRGLCHTHYRRYRKTVDPVYDRYQDFKYNALRRKKEFTITLPEFRKFCDDNGYIVVKGNRGRRCSIDRIDNRFGYHVWNIQILSMDMNILKYHEVDKLLTNPNEGEILF